MKLKQKIISLFEQAFIVAFDSSVESKEFLEITRSTQLKFGHYQCNSAMKMAKALQQSPRDIALRIQESIPKNDIIENLEIAGPGFINIHLTTKVLNSSLEELYSLDFNNIPNQKPQKIVLDFSCPNTAKEMHVGHLRSTIIGDSLSRLFEFLGHDVLRLNHIGDWGTAFGMLIAYIKQYEPQIISNPDDVDLTFLVSCYKNSKQKFDEDKDFKKRSQLEVVSLQGGNEESLKAWKILCEISRRAYEEIYDILDVNLVERGESFYNPYLQSLIDELEKNKVLEISNGAKCMFLDGFKNRDGDPLPLMLQKSDGGFNYSTTDMAALKHRIEQEHADRVIYVIDSGQSIHLQMLFAGAKKAGFLDPNKVRAEHVPFGLVLGPDGKKFKTRSGETERLIDLLNTAVSKAEQILIARENDGHSNVDANMRKETAKALGIGSVKYADLSSNRVNDYSFSYERMLQFEGNTAAFMMYSYVRVQGIKRKLDSKYDLSVDFDITHDAEKNLAFCLAQFFDTLDSIGDNLLPNQLCEYLYEVAQHFNAFFRDCRVIGSEEQNQRLKLCELTAKILKQGLEILGVKAVERM
jgi:arginyl-tRNA synthetase